MISILTSTFMMKTMDFGMNERRLLFNMPYLTKQADRMFTQLTEQISELKKWITFRHVQGRLWRKKLFIYKLISAKHFFDFGNAVSCCWKENLVFSSFSEYNYTDNLRLCIPPHLPQSNKQNLIVIEAF